VYWIRLLVAAIWVFSVPCVLAQQRPYIGYAYPAGGQQGTTFRVKLGGQAVDAVDRVFVTGSGVSAKVIEYCRALNPQEITLLNEQIKELRQSKTEVASVMMGSNEATMMSDTMMSADMAAGGSTNSNTTVGDTPALLERLTRRVAETVNRPASVALANIVYIEVTIAKDAEPGDRELRLGTPRGISNPLVFQVGLLPEVARKPMVTAPLQVLGKEAAALRKRPADEVEDRITPPCVLNGQIASGEVNRYRFTAQKGQNLVITTQARQLIPFIADAVPGWFQPVLALYDANGKELAYDDDYRFKPDPTMLFSVPEDGEYVLAVYDAIYRGREDFVYRITIGEVPFITSLFPLGCQRGAHASIDVKGWNLGDATVAPPAAGANPGVHFLRTSLKDRVSNVLPFVLDEIPERLEAETNNTIKLAQEVTLPIIINGRIDYPDDVDIYQFEGKAKQKIVFEIQARRLDSPLDSVLKLTRKSGRVIAFNDDYQDAGAGVNTHNADSYLMLRLPLDGGYCIHVGDAAQSGGEEYAYRLRISAPRPDFALRAVPSSLALRTRGSAVLNVHVMRKDGFDGPIKVSLKDPPAGFSATPVSLVGTQMVARLNVKTDLAVPTGPVDLCVIGTAKLQTKVATNELVRVAVPAEDRMQAFLWRHLVPASDLKAMVYDRDAQPVPKRVPRPRPPSEPQSKPAIVSTNGSTNASPNKPKFTKQQVAGRLRQLKLLFEEGLLTDDFYDRNVAECEAARAD
jgi:hypothetical protein